MSAASRDLDVVEFFSWQGNLRRACCKAGLAAVGYDYQRDPEQNIFLCMAGLARAISLLLPLTPNGLARFAPQCSSWVFLASSGHCHASTDNYKGRAPAAEVTAGLFASRALCCGWLRPEVQLRLWNSQLTAACSNLQTSKQLC